MPKLENAPEKLIIQAYKDSKFSSEVSGASFEVMYNPESYSLKYEQEFEEEKGKGNSSSDPKYKGTKPLGLSLEFTLDGTGVSGAKVDVVEEIRTFRDVCVDYHGEDHRPYFLHVLWGDLSIWGILKSADVKYTLFDEKGKPLRAKISATFAEIESPQDREAREKNQSPDLTHVRVVTEGDTLPLMTHRIYGDSKYYLQVAEVNKLNDYRNLKAGTKIYFPPIAKIES